jgi:hypothetical protein
LNKYTLILHLILIYVFLSAGCTPQTRGTNQIENLKISLIYPTEKTEIEMGQTLKGIIRVLDEQDNVVENAQVTLTVSDPSEKLVASLPSKFGSGDVYRTDAWMIPHRMLAGAWTLTVEAKAESHQGRASQTFRVNSSFSEKLLSKYGFWIDSPALRGIVPSLVKEQGDAHNGAITWGGIIPAQHVFPESWLEVQWREGNFNLATAHDVREFISNTLGNPGFYALRSLESFEQVRFKNWDAWKVKVRGQLSRYNEEWMIFYAAEVNKTYALGTTVVLSPVGIDAHAVLKEGFETHPEIQATGTAPKPLPKLLPPVELISPELGARFFGLDQPIVLKWKPAKELAEDEYYLVSIDYNYVEGNPVILYTTRETQFTLPESLYHLPNCGVFNWRITLMQQMGLGQNGQPKGEPISFNSLYWYVQWLYPPGQEVPFKPLCPNEQF